MKLSFVKFNPVENMTILILDKVPRNQHKKIAGKLMNYNNLQAEQVGFIESPERVQGENGPTIRLQMMGGEFCANASRSLAAYLVYKDHPSIEKCDHGYRVFLQVSGSQEPVFCQVHRTQESHVFISKIKMPFPTRLGQEELCFLGKEVSLLRVDFPGIVHFILDEKQIQDQEEYFLCIKKQMLAEKVEAFGLMFYDKEKNFLRPLVYVRATDSLFWERSCASGTSALGLALALREGFPLVKTIHQPGGELRVSVDKKSQWIITLEGRVEIVAQGSVYI